MPPVPPAPLPGLRRFWFPLPVGFGVGVSAASEAEARRLAEAARARYFPDATLGEVVADVDIRTLDQAHVVPNMGLVVERGVWYPHSGS